MDLATLAGGCFWGVEELFRQLPGVHRTRVGYTGGETTDPIYEEVKTGQTGHAEAIEIEFDPTQLAYQDLLHFFFKIHDPTTKNRQGGDVGSQYRSEIFVHGEEQATLAKQVIKEVDALDRFKDPVVTTVTPATVFYSAEEYHQDYLQKNPGGYTCHFIRD